MSDDVDPALAAVQAELAAMKAHAIERINVLTAQLADAQAVIVKFKAAADLFMAETAEDRQDAFGWTDARKSKMQIMRNGFAEALNDMR